MSIPKDTRTHNKTNKAPLGQNLSVIVFDLSNSFGLSTLEKSKITLEQIFLTVGQKNYGNKILFLTLTVFPRSNTAFDKE
jgi:hypothetical protein